MTAWDEGNTTAWQETNVDLLGGHQEVRQWKLYIVRIRMHRQQSNGVENALLRSIHPSLLKEVEVQVWTSWWLSWLSSWSVAITFLNSLMTTFTMPWYRIARCTLVIWSSNNFSSFTNRLVFWQSWTAERCTGFERSRHLWRSSAPYERPVHTCK